MLMVEKKPSSFFEKVIVHFDLKGAAPKPHYVKELLPFIKKLGFTEILMEYEDMFPYSFGLSVLRRKTAFDEMTTKQLKESANAIGLNIIPLIQTFGHFEFALKHQEFSSLREDPNWMDTICPSNERSIWLIREMISQIRHLHHDEKSIHIGCDEAYHIGLDKACQLRLNTTLNRSIDRLKLEHISRVARMAKEEFGFEQVLVWYDMFEKIPAALLEEYKLGSLIVPVVWGYKTDVARPGYFPDGLFERFSQVFDNIYFAGAFKGADGISQQFVHIERYMQTLRSYQKLYHQNEKYLKDRLTGIILTGWQRYSHTTPLCELLPAGIPSLARQAISVSQWMNKKEERTDQFMQEFLNCSVRHSTSATKFVHKGFTFPFVFEFKFSDCQFPGVELYSEIEELNLLRWKAAIERYISNIETENETQNELEKMEEEFRKLRKTIASLLGHFFYEDTVDEWLAQHGHLNRFNDDDLGLPRPNRL
ncbi:hypothetical protein niasHS_014862 [Heterodera schachtii]|uniref:Beta-N-acetylhexosaminidase n=1 Tax=Heterodera schachtii TaxID=97005 RepID=A0ABD2IP81_HETSC